MPQKTLQEQINRFKKTKQKNNTVKKKIRSEIKRYQPNTVLGQVKLFSRARVIFFNREVAVGVVSSIKHCHHPGWNPQHSHHWDKNMRNVKSFALCRSFCIYIFCFAMDTIMQKNLLLSTCRFCVSLVIMDYFCARRCCSVRRQQSCQYATIHENKYLIIHYADP